MTNILLILTDDQLLATMEYMPKVKRLLADEGMTFNRAYAADPVCAPARASILSGRHVHNHKVYDNDNTDETQKRIEGDSLPVRLRGRGYRTGLFGKYNTDPAITSLRVPPGWDAFHSFVFPRNDPDTLWFNSNGERNGAPLGKGSDCTVVGSMAENFIRNARQAGKPWFAYVATSSPHGPYMPSERHADAFRDELLPKPPNYDEADVSDKPEKFRGKYPRISKEDQGEIRKEWRGTLREVQDIDDMVNRLVGVLSETNQLDDTMIVFLTDNGYPYGHNRAWSGKGWPYSSMTRIPLVVRGPGVLAGTASDALVSQIDLLPTMMELTGGAWGDTDGRPLGSRLWGHPVAWRKRLLIDHFMQQGWAAMVDSESLYVEHSTGEKELYDLLADPYEMNSLHNSAHPEKLVALSSHLHSLRVSSGDLHRSAES